jgi:hypothetical protein
LQCDDPVLQRDRHLLEEGAVRGERGRHLDSLLSPKDLPRRMVQLPGEDRVQERRGGAREGRWEGDPFVGFVQGADAGSDRCEAFDHLLGLFLRRRKGRSTWIPDYWASRVDNEHVRWNLRIGRVVQ